MTKDTFQPTAEQAYKNDREMALEKLEAIHRLICEKMDASQARNPQSWGHAGSMGHVNEILDEAIQFIS